MWKVFLTATVLPKRRSYLTLHQHVEEDVVRLGRLSASLEAAVLGGNVRAFCKANAHLSFLGVHTAESRMSLKEPWGGAGSVLEVEGIWGGLQVLRCKPGKWLPLARCSSRRWAWQLASRSRKWPGSCDAAFCSEAAGKKTVCVKQKIVLKSSLYLGVFQLGKWKVSQCLSDICGYNSRSTWVFVSLVLKQHVQMNTSCTEKP